METKPATRHYEIDALRVIALILLIIYHIFISYQSFANMLMFLQYDQLLEKYWFIGELLNIWRIPVLFLISGMSLGFILERRSVKELISERMFRIVPPLIFGALVIFPICPLLYALYEGKPVKYQPSPGHLWFLQNLVSYTILLIPLILLVKRRPDNFLILSLRGSLPWGLLLILPVPLVLETVISKPGGFAFFPFRFWFGLICYAIGFLLPCLGEKFWSSIRKVCHLALALGILFYLGRMGYLDWPLLKANHWATGFESGAWMLAFLGYGSLLLNRPTRIFAYLNKAVFPIYIIHLPMQQLVAFIIFRWQLAPEITFGLHVILTLALCWLCYEFIIRRLSWLYPVMGLKAAGKEDDTGKIPLGKILTLYVLTPLVFLAQIGVIIAMTVSQGAAENKPAAGASDSLWNAAKNNDVTSLTKFIEDGEVSVNDVNPTYKIAALHFAALNGSAEAVNALLEAGADTDTLSGDGSTAVSHAAFMGHADIVATLIEHGAELNTVNNYQATALDNTYTDWKIVIGASKMMALTVNREQWEKGREKARELLKKNGAKHKSEL